MSAVCTQQCVMYCGAVLPATRQMLATSNVCCVDAAVRRVLWCGVTCHPADAGDEQCLLCGRSSASCTVVLCTVCAGVHSDGKAPQRGSQLTSPASSQCRSGTVAAQSVAAGTSPLPPAVVAPLRRKDFFFHVAVRSRSGAVRLRRQTCQDRRRSDFGDLLPHVLLY